jgi:hypothetical protein
MSSKVSELQELTTGANSDLLHILDDNGNATYSNKKITAGNLLSSLEKKVVYTKEVFSANARATLKAYGKQSDLDNVSIVFSGGNTVTISSVSQDLDLLAITVAYSENVNSTTSFQLVYPEPNGETVLLQSKFPTFLHFNQVGVMQAFSGWNLSNSSGTLTLQKTSLVANASYAFTVNF